MPDKDDLYQRVDAAIVRGETWRAKEILRGNIGLRGYDVDLFERYGRLLFDLGEAMEAGKYLFLSGRRSLEYERAISGYLARFSPKKPEHLYFSFPVSARLSDIDKYPDEVRRKLEGFEFPPNLDGRLYAQRNWREHWAKEKSKHPDPPLRPRAFSPMGRFWWVPSAMWFRRSSESFASKATLKSVPSPGRLETRITVLLSILMTLFLLTCLVVGVWVVVSWLAGLVL
jgi:hypothetical protein